ncbi:MAG: hypothetical protein KatS3mg032_1086 [Cyclobacteriaceae bacterium]|nr:MAG: hypothetical protein KatS3mg032_1086 [Cyclobacteriaceae bacterium]
MNIFFFRKYLPAGHNLLLAIFFAAVAAGSVYLIAGYLKGPSSVMHWQLDYAQHATEARVAAFESGGFQFMVPAEVYLTFSFFRGSDINPPVTAAGIFTTGLVLGVVVLLTLITTLPRFWFFAGMALFIAFMVSLRLEVLYLFSIYGRTVPVIILMVCVLVAFYFNVLRPHTPWLIRFGTFLLLAAITAIVTNLFSGVPHPVFHLAVTGYWPALIITLIFVLTVAHEIPALFAYLSSRAASGRKNALHFTLLWGLYIALLLLLYFDETGIYPLNMPRFPVYLLLITSALLGYWGFRQRRHLYAHIFSFVPAGALFYTALAAVGLFTTGFLTNAYNDAALKVLREWVLFCHLGYGIIFFTYVVSNFMVMMAQNLPVYRVLYKPSRMPYFTFRLAGLIATLAFVFYMNWKEYVYHAMGGYYNNLGDLHELLGKPAFAEAFYQQVRSYAFQNNRANYQLGIKETERHNREEAAHLFELANARRPTPYSYINAGNLFTRTGSWFEAIRLYRKGFEKFHDPHLALNLGYAYARVHKTDSAIFFTEEARKFPKTKALAESNFLALIGQEYIPVQADSVAATLEPSVVLQANTLALAVQRRQQTSLKTPDVLPNNALDVPAATLLHNYLLSKLGRTDLAFMEKVQQAATDSVNADYSEALKAALAYARYYSLNVTEAFNLITEVSFVSIAHEGRYHYLLGLWATEQGAHELAMHHFERAAEAGYKDAAQYLTIASALAGYSDKAKQNAARLLQAPDSVWRTMGTRIINLLTAEPARLTADDDLYLFCIYRLSADDNRIFETIFNRFTDDNYRALALVFMSNRQLRVGNLSAALNYSGKINTLNVTDEEVKRKAAHHELLIHALTKDIRGLKEKLSPNLSFKGFEQQYLLLFRAMLAEDEGNLAEATRLFDMLAVQNPFFEEGVLEAARFYSRHRQDDYAAYNLLAEAIQLNRYSYRLLLAYADEAGRLGFDTYAESARSRAEEIRKRL